MAVEWSGVPDGGARRVEGMVTRHGPALLRIANQFSLCHDDALDAYQRALEIYLRRLDTVEPATEGAWMRVVVKHEAMAVRRTRAQSVERDDVDLDASVASGSPEVEEQVAGGERVDRSVEALRALKPDEAKALMLKAQGLSYHEIGKRFGWTYTKVNRSITEGRARFLKEFRGIEEGAACARYASVLEALADGTATSAQLVAIRPHLRHCTACRAAVRDMRLSRRRRIALLLPAWQLLTRIAGSGTVTQYASVSGGGRLGAAAALAGLCFTGVGAGTVCVVTGSVHAPPLVPHAHRPASHVVRHRHRHPPARAAATPIATTMPIVPRATATPRPRIARIARRPAAKHNSKPTGEFGFEDTASGGAAPRVTASASSIRSSPPPAASGSRGSSEFSFESG